jgi:hypothetical protein
MRPTIITKPQEIEKRKKDRKRKKISRLVSFFSTHIQD